MDCFDNSDEANCTMAVVPAVPFKGHSMMDNVHEVKIRKPTTLAALSKNKVKRTQKIIQKERKEATCSRCSQRKLRQ
jgi:hypothetical protein